MLCAAFHTLHDALSFPHTVVHSFLWLHCILSIDIHCLAVRLLPGGTAINQNALSFHVSVFSFLNPELLGRCSLYDLLGAKWIN